MTKRLAILLVIFWSSAFLTAQSFPNSTLTPGAVRTLTKKQVCATKWGLDHRHVTAAMKRQVRQAYHIKTVVAKGKGPCCEYDHKVPREIGGADNVKNIWLQPWDEATLKDAEENTYHRQVCAGIITLADAQQHFLHWGEE